jgi:TrmH family RNA methyltransferase
VGALAVIVTPRTTLPAAADFCLLLDGLQDPGNVGSILRSAAAAGVKQVLLSKKSAFAWSPKVLRAGQGAHFLTTIVEDVDLAAWAAAFRAGGGRVAALVARDGTSLFRADLARPLALAVGNEGAGLSRKLADRADLRLTIPMPGGMESLNVGAAAAVALFECVRGER